MAKFLRRLQINLTHKIKAQQWVIKPKPITNCIYSSVAGVAVLTTGFCVSSYACNHNKVIASGVYDENDYHFDFLDNLSDLAIKIDASSMLHTFLQEKKVRNLDGSSLFSTNFVIKLFKESGITDEELIGKLIHIMDWNDNNMLTQYEVAALFTLFNVGSDQDRYNFLFKCLDLDESGTVRKSEFREILTCLLEAKYHLFGLQNDRDPDEIYTNIEEPDFHTMAKFQANQLTRKIFLFADPKKKGKLNWRQFIHWCYRGGSEVKTLKELLYQTHDQSIASEVVHPYKVGNMNAHLYQS